jgi:hypothetical protein
MESQTLAQQPECEFSEFHKTKPAGGGNDAGRENIDGLGSPHLRRMLIRVHALDGALSHRCMQCKRRVEGKNERWIQVRNFSAVMGNRRTRLPVAAKIALATAGATKGTAVSPNPPGG